MKKIPSIYLSLSTRKGFNISRGLYKSEHIKYKINVRKDSSSNRTNSKTR